MTWWCLPSAPTSSHLTPLHLVGQILLPSTCSGKITIGNSCPPLPTQSKHQICSPPFYLTWAEMRWLLTFWPSFLPPLVSSLFLQLFINSGHLWWDERRLRCFAWLSFPRLGQPLRFFFIPSMACCSRPFVHGSEGPHISLMLAFSICCTQISKDKSGTLSISLVRGDTLKWTYSQHNHTP